MIRLRTIVKQIMSEVDTNIFSPDDQQSWPSGPFGKKDFYADESGDSYERDPDWQIDKPGHDEDTVDTGYKKVTDPKEAVKAGNTKVDQDFINKHKYSMSKKMGSKADPSTYDGDDKDGKDLGYEPVKSKS